MSAIDDHLLLSEGRVTDATLSMDPPADPMRAAIQAQLALVDAIHAQTLALQENTAAMNRVCSIRFEAAS